MLVLASIVTAIALSVNQSAYFSGDRVKTYSSTADARMIAMYCAESLLMQIKDNPGLVDTSTMSYDGGVCNYTVSGSAPNKTISITAVKNNLYKKLTITTTQINPTITSTWVVGD